MKRLLILLLVSTAWAQHTPDVISLVPSDVQLTLTQPEKRQITLYYCHYHDGQQDNCSTLPGGGTWTSSAPSVVSVAAVDVNHGELTATAASPGTANIHYTNSGVDSNTIPVTVATQVMVTPALPIGITSDGPGTWTTHGTVFDTTDPCPGTGTTYTPANAGAFTAALASVVPGDNIVLTAGTNYIGNFTLPARSNPSNKWTCIYSSEMSSLPPQGTRVIGDVSKDRIADASHMPKIITPNYVGALMVAAGADHWWISGVEVYSTSTAGCDSTNPNQVGCSTNLVSSAVDPDVSTDPATMPSNITIDRCYLHGSATQDLRRAVIANAAYYAVLDSYISDVHAIETQAIAAWYTPGPLKIVNNFLEAAGENTMIGGAGSTSLPESWVPHDIEFRRNHYYSPLSWYTTGILVKNLFELKSGVRVLAEGNKLENMWVSAQSGLAFNIKNACGNQGGNHDVTEDVTIQSNWSVNTSGVLALSTGITTGDNAVCSPNAGYTNPGELKRVLFANNLSQLADTTNPPFTTSGYYAVITSGNINSYSGIQNYQMDTRIQHNTLIGPPNRYGNCIGAGILVDYATFASQTRNWWVMDNNLCHSMRSDSYLGVSDAVLTQMMGDPSSPATTNRLRGNYLYVPSTFPVFLAPTSNVNTRTAPTYVPGTYQADTATCNTTNLTTSDGACVGIVWSQLQAALGVSALAYAEPTSMPNGTFGATYPATDITVTGGTAPYTCTLQSGPLPLGLVLSACSVTGTPSLVGVYSGIVFRVTDSAVPTPGFVDSPSLSITINPSAPTLGVKISQNIRIGTGIDITSVTSALIITVSVNGTTISSQAAGSTMVAVNASVLLTNLGAQASVNGVNI